VVLKVPFPSFESKKKEKGKGKKKKRSPQRLHPPIIMTRAQGGGRKEKGKGEERNAMDLSLFPLYYSILLHFSRSRVLPFPSGRWIRPLPGRGEFSLPHRGST